MERKPNRINFQSFWRVCVGGGVYPIIILDGYSPPIRVPKSFKLNENGGMPWDRIMQG